MKDLLNIELFSIGKTVLYFHNILISLLLILSFFFAGKVIKKVVYSKRDLDSSKKFSINKLIQYVLAVIATLFVINTLGFDISLLIAGSAAILVGIGFGIQNLFNDFISGIILLMDSTIKVNDIIEVNNKIYKIIEINFRFTTMLGRDDNYVIVPNSELTKNTLINWTHSSITSRFPLKIGVSYETDIKKFVAICTQITSEHPSVLHDKEIEVRFVNFADSALEFDILFYTDEIFRVERTKSEIRYRLFEALKQAQINIPFPQRVVHLMK